MLGVFANAVELGTMPTIRKVYAPTCSSSPTFRPSVLDTAISSGVDGARPDETPGMPGPCSGAPNAVLLRVDVPSLIAIAEVANGAAATTPGSAATRGTSTSANGVEPMNGPAAPALTTKPSTPIESTVRCASTWKPFASPVMTRVIANTSPVLTIAIMRRRVRHCMSRKAANSMPARVPTTRHFRTGFDYLSHRNRTLSGHCFCPDDVSLETKRCRHLAVAIHEVQVIHAFAARPRQQSARSQHPDVTHSQTLIGRRRRQSLDSGLGLSHIIVRPAIEECLHQKTRRRSTPHQQLSLADHMVDGSAHERYGLIVIAAPSPLPRQVHVDDC